MHQPYILLKTELIQHSRISVVIVSIIAVVTDITKGRNADTLAVAL